MFRPRVPIVIYAHPFELFLSAVLVINGARPLVTRETSPAIAELSPVVVGILTAMGLTGGVLMLVGLLSRTKPVGRVIERVGLWLAASAYLGYAVALYGAYPLTLVWANVATAVGMGTACIARERAIRKTELTILRTLRKANRDDDLIRKVFDARGINTSEKES